MLKKLMSFLFEEEEEEVYSDDELEEAIFKDVPTTSQPKVKPQPKTDTQAPVFAQPKPSLPIQQPHSQKKEEPRKFTTIDLEPKKIKTEPRPVARHRSITADGPVAPRSEKVKSEFNLAPIISPIFGSDDEETKKSSKTSAVTGLPKKKNSIGVISPMYGTGTPEEPLVKTVTEKRHAVIKEEIKEEPKAEDINLPNIPLEDIIKKDEDIEDDSMQISLFGEDAPIHEKSAADYKIEE